MALRAMKWQADVSASDIEFCVFSRHDDHRCFGVRAVMAGAGFRHVDDRRVVEHCAIPLWNGAELGHECLDLFHVVRLDRISHFCGARNLSAMANLVNAGLLIVFGKRCDIGSEIIDGVSDDIGET